MLLRQVNTLNGYVYPTFGGFMSESLRSLMALNNEFVEYLENGGELTDDFAAQFGHLLDVQIPDKTDGCFLIMERLELEADRLKAKAESFAIAAKQLNSARERLKEYIKFQMQNSGLTELQGNDYKFGLSKTKPSVVIQNEELIPDGYTHEVVTRKIDKDRIREDLALGIPVEGATLVESFSLRSSINKKLTSKRRRRHDSTISTNGKD